MSAPKFPTTKIPILFIVLYLFVYDVTTDVKPTKNDNKKPKEDTLRICNKERKFTHY